MLCCTRIRCNKTVNWLIHDGVGPYSHLGTWAALERIKDGPATPVVGQVESTARPGTPQWECLYSVPADSGVFLST